MACRDRAEPKKVPPIPERHGRMLRPTLCVLALAAGTHGAPVKRESKEASAKRPAWYVRASAGKLAPQDPQGVCQDPQGVYQGQDVYQGSLIMPLIFEVVVSHGITW